MELKRGYTFNFRNTIWKITEVYEIKWDDGTVSKEYKLKSDRGFIRYLEIHIDKNEESYSFWTPEYNKSFIYKAQKSNEEDVVILGKAKFPKKINLKGVAYLFDEKNTGVCKYGITNLYETERVDSLDYVNRGNSRYLSIELWDDEIEVSTGIPIEKDDIRNVEKGSSLISGSMIANWANNYIGLFLGLALLVIIYLFNRCDSRNSWNSNESRYQNDSTKVHRSNNHYRARTSRGFGK